MYPDLRNCRKLEESCCVWSGYPRGLNAMHGDVAPTDVPRKFVLARCVPWTICPWDYTPLGRYVPWTTLLGQNISWTIRLLDNMYLGRYASWTICLLDDKPLRRYAPEWCVRFIPWLCVPGRYDSERFFLNDTSLGLYVSWTIRPLDMVWYG